MTNKENIDIINNRYAARVIKYHQQLLNAVAGEHFEEAAELRDTINQDLESVAQYNVVMSGQPIEVVRKMLEENKAFIMNELTKKK